MQVMRVLLTAIVVLLLSGFGVCNAQQQPELSAPQVGKLPKATQMHGSAVIGERLYIFGGENADGWSNLVWSAPVGSNGAVGQWRSEAPLPVRLTYLNNCVEVIGNRIYIIGGVVADGPKTEETKLVRNQNVFWSSTDADGVIQPWKKSPPFPGPHLSCMATASTDEHLVVTGGSTWETVANSVYVADISASGEPGNWRLVGSLPKALWHHGAAIQGDRLYVWGGIISRKNASQITLDPAPMNDDAWSAELKPDGSLGPWRKEAAMRQPTFGAASSGFNDYLLSIGGRYRDKSPTNVVWFTRLDEGKAVQWELARTDLSARVFHSLGLDRTRGVVFVTGGQIKTAPGSTPIQRLDTVQAFVIPQPEGARLDQAKIRASAPPPLTAALQQQPAVSQAAADYLPLNSAFETAKQGQKPVLAFFFSPQVPACKRFWDQVVVSPEFRALGQDYIMAFVDISGPDAPLGPRYGIYKVPALALLESNGALRRSSVTIRTNEDVQHLLDSP